MNSTEQGAGSLVALIDREVARKDEQPVGWHGRIALSHDAALHYLSPLEFGDEAVKRALTRFQRDYMKPQMLGSPEENEVRRYVEGFLIMEAQLALQNAVQGGGRVAVRLQDMHPEAAIYSFSAGHYPSTLSRLVHLGRNTQEASAAEQAPFDRWEAEMDAAIRRLIETGPPTRKPLTADQEAAIRFTDLIRHGNWDVGNRVPGAPRY